jgi:hypothetical protein
MPNDSYIEERIKPGVRRWAAMQTEEPAPDEERKAIQALLKQVAPGPTHALLAKLLNHMGLAEEEETYDTAGEAPGAAGNPTA